MQWGFLAMAKNKETGGRVSKETRLLLLKRLHEARTAARAAEARATMYGRLLLAAEEGTWYAPPLAIPVKNPAGAGDGAVAGLCHALLRGAPPPEQLESAVRVASAVCLTPGTAEFHVADLASLPPVRIQTLSR